MVDRDIPALMPSVLDRLLDDEPLDSAEPLWFQSMGVSQLLASVRRDLEGLLNSRRSLNLDAKKFPEASRSVLTFGMPDFVGISGNALADAQAVRLAVEQAIGMFEPRLKDVRVSLREQPTTVDRKLQLTIEAILHVDPIKEPITFDTVVMTATGDCKVVPRD